MKKIIAILLLCICRVSCASGLEKVHFVETSIGKIAVHKKEIDSPKVPVVFLHGLFFDHHLWDYQVGGINDRSVYVLDMPLHGLSKGVKPNWNMADCTTMLLEILDALQLKHVHAVGHSWGGMTLLRAAQEHAYRFESITFFNTPYTAYSNLEKLQIKLQLTGLVFKKLFLKKAAQNLFSKESLTKNPALNEYFLRSMKGISNASIRYLNKVVRIDAEDKTDEFSHLNLRSKIIVGKEDYIAPAPNHGDVILLDGGHTTPLEKPEQSLQLIIENLTN